MENIFIISAFTGGILSFFSPCIIPVLPVYIGILTGNGDDLSRKKAILRTLLFILGLSTIFVILGFGLSFIGDLLFSDIFLKICGAVIILFGLIQLEVIKLNFLNREASFKDKASKPKGYFGTYVLGLAFSFAWTPCVGPILAAILTLSASSDNALYGGLMMSVYSLGFAIPFLVISIFSNTILQKVKKINKYLPLIKKIGGVILIVIGLLLVFELI